MLGELRFYENDSGADGCANFESHVWGSLARASTPIDLAQEESRPQAWVRRFVLEFDGSDSFNLGGDVLAEEARKERCSGGVPEWEVEVGAKRP
jgi:hypothetical protein